MTRQTKSHLLILALVPAVVFGAVRCADATAVEPDPSVVAAPLPQGSATLRLAKLRDEKQWIGDFHNDALRYVFASIQRVPAKERDRRKICEAARKAYAEFHRTRRAREVPAVVDAAFSRFCASGSTAERSFSYSMAVPAGTARREVSPGGQSMMDQISSASDASTSYSDLAERVGSIELTASATLSPDDAAAVVTVGTVALSSADYWANNLTAWVPLTSGPEYATLFSMQTAGFDPRTTGPAYFDGFEWNTFAARVWTDAKAAAKRAAHGDIMAAAKTVIATGVAGSPIIYEIVIASAATGSIMAVLQQ